jgi:hypothetical protein
MTTVRQIERYWTAREFTKLFHSLLAPRPEAKFRLEVEVRPALAAAIGVIRLDELAQSHAPLYTRLVRAILAAQEADGGWGDPVTTALCLRALMCGRGEGVAVERGLAYLANLQKAEGIWPALPLRRMPADPHVSAFLLAQLGDSPGFRAAMRFDQAVQWFRTHVEELDRETAGLWDRAALRCRVRSAGTARLPATVWAEVA